MGHKYIGHKYITCKGPTAGRIVRLAPTTTGSVRHTQRTDVRVKLSATQPSATHVAEAFAQCQQSILQRTASYRLSCSGEISDASSETEATTLATPSCLRSRSLAPLMSAMPRPYAIVTICSATAST